MEGIPPARKSDNEGVIWALETAESLWKRNARVDAIVWLRRAAQEAAEAGDDDRASSLMVEASSLTESLGRVSASMRAAQPITQPPPSGEASGDGADPSDLDALLAMDVDIVEPESPAEETPVAVELAGAASGRSSMVNSSDIIEIGTDDVFTIPTPVRTPVPTGEASPGALAEVAGDEEFAIDDDALILDDEEILDDSPPDERGDVAESPTLPPAEPAVADAPAEPEDVPATPEPEEAFAPLEPEEVLAPLEPEEVLAPLELEEAFAAPEIEPTPEAEVEIPGITRMGDGAISALDLAASPTLAAASTEQQELLVGAAHVILCAEGVVVPHFALALVLEGEITVSAEADGPIVGRTGQGTLLRARGTLDVLGQPHPHFTVSADDTTLALWSEEAVATALAETPSIDDELRQGGDRWIAWATVASSALAGNLHEDVRLRLVERMKTRAIAPDAAVLAVGEPVGGMLLVGYGSVTVEGGRELEAGDFVFPEATLSAGKASAAAHAGPDGVILITADRRTTQELYATEPLLLELLSASC